MPGFDRKEEKDKAVDTSADAPIPSVLDVRVNQATRERMDRAQAELDKRKDQKDKVDQALSVEQGEPKTLGEKLDRDIAAQNKILKNNERGPDGKPKVSGLEKIMASITILMLFMDKMKNYAKLKDPVNTTGTAGADTKKTPEKTPNQSREENIISKLKEGKDVQGGDLPPPKGYQELEARLNEQLDQTKPGPAKDLADANAEIDRIRVGKADLQKTRDGLKSQVDTASEAEKPTLQQKLADAESALKASDLLLMEVDKNRGVVAARVAETKANLDVLKKMVADRKKEAEQYGKQFADLTSGLDTSGVELTDEQKNTVNLLRGMMNPPFTVDYRLQGVLPTSGLSLRAANVKALVEELKAAKVLQPTDSYSAIGIEASSNPGADLKIQDFRKFAEVAQKYIKTLMKPAAEEKPKA